MVIHNILGRHGDFFLNIFYCRTVLVFILNEYKIKEYQNNEMQLSLLNILGKKPKHLFIGNKMYLYICLNMHENQADQL